MHHGTNNDIRIIPCWSMPDRNDTKEEICTEEGATNQSKRKPNLVNTHCIFCGGTTTTESLHEFTTFNMDKVIRDMVHEMGDTDLLVKLSGGMDIVAIEGKYHSSCLTNYRYFYHSFLRTQCGSLDKCTKEILR